MGLFITLRSSPEPPLQTPQSKLDRIDRQSPPAVARLRQVIKYAVYTHVKPIDGTISSSELKRFEELKYCQKKSLEGHLPSFLHARKTAPKSFPRNAL